MKKYLILIINLIVVIGCSGQNPNQTWKKFNESIADFELPAKDLRMVGRQEDISPEDSLTFAILFDDLKIDKKIRYKATGDKIRCSIMIYYGQVDTDSLKFKSSHLMEVVKQEFSSEIFQIKKEEIKRVGKNLYLNLSVISESQAGVINYVTWIGDKFVVTLALEGEESDINYFHDHFRLKDY